MGWRAILPSSWTWKSNQAMHLLRAGEVFGRYRLDAFLHLKQFHRCPECSHWIYSEFVMWVLWLCMIKLETLLRPRGKAQWDNTVVTVTSCNTARVLVGTPYFPSQFAGCSWWASVVTGNVSRDWRWCVPQSTHYDPFFPCHFLVLCMNSYIVLQVWRMGHVEPCRQLRQGGN